MPTTRPMLALLLLASLGCAPAPPPEEDDDGLEFGRTSQVEWNLGGFDDWVFSAELTPWPPSSASLSTIRASASVDDYDRRFRGTVAYRLAESTFDFPQWVPMDEVFEDEAEVVFESSLELPPGTYYLIFKVQRDFDDQAFELEDWQIIVE